MASPYDDFQAPSPYAEFQAPRPKIDEPPGVLSRLGTGLYESTLKPAVDIGSGLLNNPGETIKNVGKGMLNTALGTEDLGNAYKEIKSGHPVTGIIHGVESLNEGPAGRQARGMVEPIAEDVKQGNYAGATGRTLGTAGQLALGAKGAGKIPEVAEIPRIAGTAARTTGAAIKGAAPDVGMGLAKVGAAAGLEETPIPNYVKYAAGVPTAVSGAKQIASGVKKGLQAGKTEYNAPQVQPISGRIATPPPIPGNPTSTLEPGGQFSHLTPGSEPLPISVPNSGLRPVLAPGSRFSGLDRGAELFPVRPEPQPGPVQGLEPFDQPQAAEGATAPRGIVSPITKPVIPSSGLRISPEILRDELPTQPHAPFAPDTHKSAATVGRQLRGEGTMAEGTTGIRSASISALERLKSNPEALQDAIELRRAVGGSQVPPEPPAASGRITSSGTERTAIEGIPPAKPAASSSQPSAGAATEVLVPGESNSYPARYEVVELNDVQASHNGQTFQPNPKYTLKNDRDYSRRENQGKVVNGALPGQFKPQFLINDNPDPSNGPPLLDSAGNAIGGNGRTMILHRVMTGNPQGAAEYRGLLAQKAQQFGIDPKQVEGMKNPVLVRRISDQDLANPQNAVTDFNKTGTAALRGSERAIADSRRVSTDTLDHIGIKLDAMGPDADFSKLLAGKSGTEVLNKLIDDGVISPQERAAYADRDILTKDGQARISKLLLGRFFRDPAQLDTIPTTIKNKLERAAAPLAKLEGTGEWNLTPKIQEAMDLIEESESRGASNVEDITKQAGMFEDHGYSPEAIALARAFKKTASPQLAQMFKQYAAEENAARDFESQKSGLFGAQITGEPPQAADAFNKIFQGGK